MTQHFNLSLKFTLVVVALLAMPLAQAANLSKDEYKAGKTRISADYKAAKAACASQADNARDICQEEAKAHEKVALAENEYSFSGKATDERKLRTVKADTSYAVAKERCDDLSGNAKDVCVKEAKAVHIKALADVKLDKKITQAEQDSMDSKRDADYKVAVEKCDAGSGDAKASCISAAKAKYGMN
jgi:hypothetical protein